MDVREEAIKERLKDAIADYVKRSSGGVKPSEIAWYMGLPVELVSALCQELIKEGTLGTKKMVECEPTT
jgi:predicted transcriptional regulator